MAESISAFHLNILEFVDKTDCIITNLISLSKILLHKDVIVRHFGLEDANFIQNYSLIYKYKIYMTGFCAYIGDHLLGG